jgi:hypothetical protein
MKKSIKNLYLPGTNKNVGYILYNDTMCIYKRYIKYFPFEPLETDGLCHFARLANKAIFTQEVNGVETNIQLYSWVGYFYNVVYKTYDFFNCTFKTPDNLDLIEMTYLYKNWNKKK